MAQGRPLLAPQVTAGFEREAAGSGTPLDLAVLDPEQFVENFELRSDRDARLRALW